MVQIRLKHICIVFHACVYILKLDVLLSDLPACCWDIVSKFIGAFGGGHWSQIPTYSEPYLLG